MNYNELVENIRTKKSFLCIGLDTDIKKIPQHLLSFPDPVFEFNKQIIDATHQYCVAYKPNIAFYESLGASGWLSLQKTLEYIPKNIFTIADAKRGDIGNTSGLYARAFFDKSSSGLYFDSVTVAPYMGKDSVTPFLEFKNNWVILLALTSNSGSSDFQLMQEGDEKLYERVIRTSQTWATHEQMMYVVGATHAEELAIIRKLAPKHFFLVPGVGAQGGSLQEVAKYGMNENCGLLVNSSRNIIYASTEKDFAEAAASEAKNIKEEMEKILQ
ncbi:MAG: orotidine-5'-phosphate decarboxylase [Sphingobacteriales bacterium]|nr:MAG: orotidine-5'-phosphate decarboxylase [Sphingobacteriales bacterium]